MARRSRKPARPTVTAPPQRAGSTAHPAPLATAPTWRETRWLPSDGRAARIVGGGLITLAVAALIGAMVAAKPGYPMPEDVGVAVLGLVAVACGALVMLRDGPLRARLGPLRAGWPLVVAAILASFAWSSFGRFHGLTFVHHWEQFHHVLGAKYFPELGYDGLYAASVDAERGMPGRPGTQEQVRDLRDDTVIRTDSARFLSHLVEVRERFSPERRAAFAADNGVFVDLNDRGYLEAMRRDHGINATPTWIAVGRAFASLVPISRSGLELLGLLDIALLVIAVSSLWRTFGARAGALAIVILGVSYAGRFWWIGGAFLREDWLALLVIGVCQLERGRERLAGFAIAWAAAMRIFPVLFLLGPAIAFLARRQWRSLARLVVGAALGGALAFGVGCLAGRGVNGWKEFAVEIERHSRTWLTNNVGLGDVVLYGAADMKRELVDFSLPEPWIHWQARMDARASERAPLLWGARLALVALFAWACRRASPTEAAALGIALVFAFAFTTCYYWQMLVMLLAFRSITLLHAVLALNLAMFGLHFASPSFELRYGLMSWALLLLLGGLLIATGRRPSATEAAPTLS